MTPEELIAIHAKTDAMERVNMRVHITMLETALTALVKHWREGESVHEMEELMDRAEAALRKPTV